MKRGRRNGLIFLSIFVLLVLPLTTAGFFDDFLGKLKITGKVTNTTNVTISVSGATPVTVGVRNATLTGTDVDPTTNTLTKLKFFVVVDDPDGAGDINTSSVNATVQFHQAIGEVVRSNGSYNCLDKGSIDSTSRNFSCSIDIWFF